MSKRVAPLIVTAVAAFSMLALPALASAAPAPWWQVLTGSYPTNLWEPEPSVQELKTETIDLEGPFAVIELKVGGTTVGCLGTENPLGTEFCEFGVGFPVTETAAELEAVLESAFGTAVEVTGGPVGGAPFVIKASGATPALGVEPLAGSAEVKSISPGGSGRLVLTLTNLGDAPVDGTETPVTIVDELPEGVVASGVEAFAGAIDSSGPVDCTVEGSDLVTCTFEGTLPSYEAIEIEVLASLEGSPPVAGAPGKVTVSGGNAPGATAVQAIKVSPDPAPFGIRFFSHQAEEEGGGPVVQAGAHPFQLTSTFQLNTGRLSIGEERKDVSIEQPALFRNARVSLPAGFVGNATTIEQCPMKVFVEINTADSCPPETALGVVSATVVENDALGLTRLAVPVFNLPPAQGEPARFGFVVKGAPVIIGTSVDPGDDYRIVAEATNTSQVAAVLAATVTIWGSPADPRHDSSRGWACTSPFADSEDLGPCVRPSGLKEEAFLRAPVSCVTPLDFGFEAEPWNVPPGSVVSEASFGGGTMSGCSQVPFEPTLGVSPTSSQALASSGLNFQLDMPNAGLLDPKAISEGQAKKVEVILPEGMTVNPSQAEGLAACSPAQLAAETASSPPGAGCPEAAKVAGVQVSTPLIEEEVKGSLYIAEPYDNPFDSLLAVYMVAKSPARGVLVKQAGKVELDPGTGQIVSTFDDLPQVPFDSFKVNFFEGNRAALVMPPKCDDYQIETRFTPWSASDPYNPLPSEVVTRTSSFTVGKGPDGGPCQNGTPPFSPVFTAGTTSNAAGAFSPLNLRLTRQDGEGEFSRFSVKLPQGVLGILAGIPFCSDAAIAAAQARTGPGPAADCDPASQIGRVLVGSGVGPDLTYVPGKIYLAGPYQGAKLSVVVITPAKVGPFDLGNVVIRQALRVDPATLEVTSDGSTSTPIPRILQGVVVHARDIRVYLDRDRFIFNPTSCEPMSSSATVQAAGGQTARLTSPFQAADCASLGFKPKSSFRLLGGTKRGDTPRFRAVVQTRKGDANFGRAQVTLPHSAFLEQAHIRTVCTRVQFSAGGGVGEQCPKGSVYGKATVTTPLLEEPARGPVFLRSSDNELPDLVMALHTSKADAVLVGRIDSLNGRIRATFDAPPDVPVTKVVLEMQGGQKGLIVNSTNICRGKHKAIANYKGQNGRRYETNPVVKAQCGGKKGGSGRRG